MFSSFVQRLHTAAGDAQINNLTCVGPKAEGTLPVFVCILRKLPELKQACSCPEGSGSASSLEFTGISGFTDEDVILYTAQRDCFT